MSDPRTLKRPRIVVYKHDPKYGPIPMHECDTIEQAQEWIEQFVPDDDGPDIYIDEGG